MSDENSGVIAAVVKDEAGEAFISNGRSALASVYTSCPAPLRDPSFTPCERCADAELFGNIDMIAPDPFFDVRPAWVEGVWARVCATIGGKRV